MMIDEIVHREFSRSFMGYDMREVDTFLDSIIDRFERYESERREMLIAMEYLLDKLERGGALPCDHEKEATLTDESPAPRRHRGPRKVHPPVPEPQETAGEADAAPSADAEPSEETASGSENEPPDQATDNNGLAGEVKMAVEKELSEGAPDPDDLFPDILKALSDFGISMSPAPKEETHENDAIHGG